MLIRSIGVLFAAFALGSAGARTQTLATRQVMHEKLVHTQRMMEALMKGRGDGIATEADALAQLTQQPGWTVLTTPEYVRYSSAFLNALTNLAAAGHDGDFDGAAVQYAGLVMTCYQCHRYVQRARLAAMETIGDGDGEGDDQRAQSRQPPAKPAQPPTAVPRPPTPKPPASPRPPSPPPHHPGSIYPYPPIGQPGFVYRFPYGVYPYYQWGYPYAPYWYPWYGYGYTFPPADNRVTVQPEEYGILRLDVTPGTASVFVDGAYAGTIEMLDRGELHLAAGPHHIDVEAAGYQTGMFDVYVQTNHTITFKTTLTPTT